MTTGGRPCPSDLLIDRHLAGELSAAESSALQQHAAGCAGCADLLARRREQLAAYQARAELGQLAATTLHRLRQEAALDPARPPRAPRGPAPAGRRTWWPRLVPLLGGLALAAVAVLLVLVWPAAAPDQRGQDHDGLRIKGDLALGAFLRRGATVEPARSGQIFHPGDELRFTCSSRRGGHLALVGVDSAGVVTLYHPTGAGAQRAATIEPGSARPLPGSAILDETLGPETVVGVLCARPFDTRALRRRAPALVAGLRRDGRAPVALLPDASCRTARFELDKRPAPAGRR